MICICTQRRNGAWYARAYVAGRLFAETREGRISSQRARHEMDMMLREMEENGIEWRDRGSVHELYADELRELAKDPLISMEAAGKRLGLGASTINRAVKRLGIKWISAKPGGSEPRPRKPRSKPGGSEPRPRKPRSKPAMTGKKHEVQPTKPANDCPEYTMGWDFNRMWRYTCPELELQGAVAGPDEMTARLNIEASLRKIAARRREHA